MQCFQQFFGFRPQNYQQIQAPERTQLETQVVARPSDSAKPIDPNSLTNPAPTAHLKSVKPTLPTDDLNLLQQPVSRHELRRCRSSQDILGHINAGQYQTMVLESSHSGHILHGRFWPASLSPQPLKLGTPPDQPKGVITLVHGMGEHSGCYHELAKSLNQQGFHVFAFDHRGHGLSQGQRGVLDHYDQLHQDVIDHIEYSRRMFPDLPQSVYAHSMGGGLILDHLKKFEAKPHLQHLQKIVVSNPWIKLQNPYTPIINVIAWILHQLRWDVVHNVARGVPHNPDRDPIVDPLCHSNISTKWYSGAQAAGMRTLRQAKEYSQQLLDKLVLLHSSNDKVTSQQATQQFAQDSQATFVDLKELSHSPHITRKKIEYFDILAHHFAQK